MISAEGETYQYRLKVSTDGAVEVWMRAVEAEMRHTLFEIMKEGTYYYAKSIRSDWIYDNLGMVTLVSPLNVAYVMTVPKTFFVNNHIKLDIRFSWDSHWVYFRFMLDSHEH